MKTGLRRPGFQFYLRVCGGGGGNRYTALVAPPGTIADTAIASDTPSATPIRSGGATPTSFSRYSTIRLTEALVGVQLGVWQA